MDLVCDCFFESFSSSSMVYSKSLALALYFASRGKGLVRDQPNAESVAYTSPARVLLNGLGSDELLGGYGRHRTAYGTGGWESVIDEVFPSLGNVEGDLPCFSCNWRSTGFPREIWDVMTE
jgi:hypothetical protein